MSSKRRARKLRIVEASVDRDRTLRVRLTGDRVLAVRPQVSDMLDMAPRKQLAAFEILGNGQWIHWPVLQEAMSAEWLVQQARKMPDLVRLTRP
jgi:hypothetical protein